MKDTTLIDNVAGASEIFKEEVRRQASTLLQGFASVDRTEVISATGNPALHGRWMSIIILAGKALKMNFRVHFNEEVAKQLALKVYAKKPEEISTAQAVDFVKEFCNLVAGGVKRTMQDHQMQSLISMPLITRGTDEVFFDIGQPEVAGELPLPKKADHEAGQQDRWTIQTERGDILCSVTFDILEPDAVQTLKDKKTDDAAEEEVEFL